MRRAAVDVLSDPVVEAVVVRPAAEETASGDRDLSVHVLPKPGVTDPEAESALALLRDLGYHVDGVRTIRTYRLVGPREGLPRLIQRLLANDAVEQAIVGPLEINHLAQGRPYDFRLLEAPIRGLDDEALLALSRSGQLSLSLAEMRAIRDHFASLGRDPTDCELETLAQTWSEHCSHKTLKGRIAFEGRTIDNLLKETIFGATRELDSDWLVSVFSDNAGVIRFDEEHDVCFKVETHNHPSAIDPYGGSNTGLGGVIRDALGTGLGAKPICNTDVFCVAPPDLEPGAVPAGVLHPEARTEGRRRRGARLRQPHGHPDGQRCSGDRSGLPGQPPGLLRHGRRPAAGDGRQARRARRPHRGYRRADGPRRHPRGDVQLGRADRAQRERLGGAVQIGNAITEKMVLDVIVQARDRGLFRAITDCGAGGFSSAVGEMGAELGAEVELSHAPLKYAGLSYTEIWISEAQERMVLAVPDEKWPELQELCRREGVEATDLGRFVATGRLTLRYRGELVGDLSMDFLHEGRPTVVREATWSAPPTGPSPRPRPATSRAT